MKTLLFAALILLLASCNKDLPAIPPGAEPSIVVTQVVNFSTKKQFYYKVTYPQLVKSISFYYLATLISIPVKETGMFYINVPGTNNGYFTIIAKDDRIYEFGGVW